jgi:type II secretory pathway predicted ATPase ExeA
VAFHNKGIGWTLDKRKIEPVYLKGNRFFYVSPKKEYFSFIHCGIPEKHRIFAVTSPYFSGAIK